MRRGDVVIVAASGDHAKPRPAVVVQTDAIGDEHPSVVVCQMTSVLVDTPDLRVTIEPNADNGLVMRSQIMADKAVTIRRDRVGGVIGQVGRAEMLRLNRCLAFIMGMAD